MMKTIQNSNRNKSEYTVWDTDIILLEKSNIDFQEVCNQLTKLPRQLLSLIDNIYVGYFDELVVRAVNAAYMDGSIYMTSDQSSVEDALDDIIHELGHAYEEHNPGFVYGDREIANEFLNKRKKLHSLLMSRGFDTQKFNFEDVNYNPHFDDFLFSEVGYSLIQNLVGTMFITPYAAASLREYFSTSFESYFLYKYRQQIKQSSPAIYEKLEMIEDSFDGN